MSRGTWALGRGRLYVIVPGWLAMPILRWIPGATGGYTNKAEWGGEQRFLPFVRVYGDWRARAGSEQRRPNLPTTEGERND